MKKCHGVGEQDLWRDKIKNKEIKVPCNKVTQTLDCPSLYSLDFYFFEVKFDIIASTMSSFLPAVIRGQKPISAQPGLLVRTCASVCVCVYVLCLMKMGLYGLLFPSIFPNSIQILLRHFSLSK